MIHGIIHDVAKEPSTRAFLIPSPVLLRNRTRFLASEGHMACQADGEHFSVAPVLWD
jgi:hypothetical protein